MSKFRILSFAEMEKMIFEHEKWLKGEGGKRANFARCSFRGVVVSKKDLSWAIFSHSDFVAATFSECNLQNTSFRDADLRFSSFQNCSLTTTDFTDAILDFSSFMESAVAHCNFSNSELNSSRFIKTELDSLDLYKAKSFGNIFGLPDRVMMQAEILMLLDRYCNKQYGKSLEEYAKPFGGVLTDGTVIASAVTDGGQHMQCRVNIAACSIDSYIDGKVIDSKKFDGLESLARWFPSFDAAESTKALGDKNAVMPQQEKKIPMPEPQKEDRPSVLKPLYEKQDGIAQQGKDSPARDAQKKDDPAL